MIESGQADDFEGLGLTADDLEFEVSVLPDNWPAVKVFLVMQTQWRVGMAGPTGLDYGALPTVENRLGIRRSHRKAIFAALRIMEAEALEALAENRKSKTG